MSTTKDAAGDKPGDRRIAALHDWLKAIVSHSGRELVSTDAEYIGLALSQDGRPFIYQIFKDGTPARRIRGFEIYVAAFGVNDLEGTLEAATEAVSDTREIESD